MCFDTAARAADRDCPVIWLDHEEVIPLGETSLRRRDAVQPFARPLYASYREVLLDIFSQAPQVRPA
jgi:hypothetical protein